MIIVINIKYSMNQRMQSITHLSNFTLCNIFVSVFVITYFCRYHMHWIFCFCTALTSMYRVHVQYINWTQNNHNRLMSFLCSLFWSNFLSKLFLGFLLYECLLCIIYIINHLKQWIEYQVIHNKIPYVFPTTQEISYSGLI